MKAAKIKENTYWVGVIDWNIRNFHGYLVQKCAATMPIRSLMKKLMVEMEWQTVDPMRIQ